MSLINYEQRDRVGIITLNRPERHNSLTPAMLDELHQTLTVATADVRALVLQANGRSFSTGGDVNGFVEHDAHVAAYAHAIVGQLNACMLAMIDHDVPIVAAVHGIVTGGSMGLVLASDLVVAARSASFTPFHGVLGISPDGGWTTLLPDIIGRNRAASWLYLNSTISAAQALDWGLVNHLCAAKKNREIAFDMARQIAAKKPGSVRHTKRLLWHKRDKLAKRLEMERQHFVEHVVTDEARDGWREFLAARRQLA